MEYGAHRVQSFCGKSAGADGLKAGGYRKHKFQEPAPAQPESHNTRKAQPKQAGFADAHIVPIPPPRASPTPNNRQPAHHRKTHSPNTPPKPRQDLPMIGPHYSHLRTNHQGKHHADSRPDHPFRPAPPAYNRQPRQTSRPFHAGSFPIQAYPKRPSENKPPPRQPPPLSPTLAQPCRPNHNDRTRTPPALTPPAAQSPTPPKQSHNHPEGGTD